MTLIQIRVPCVTPVIFFVIWGKFPTQQATQTRTLSHLCVTPVELTIIARHPTKFEIFNLLDMLDITLMNGVLDLIFESISVGHNLQNHFNERNPLLIPSIPVFPSNATRRKIFDIITGCSDRALPSFHVGRVVR